MEKIEQTDKYNIHRTEKKKKIWDSIYLLELLLVREDCGRVDRVKVD
jgi:hypothetical protein